MRQTSWVRKAIKYPLYAILFVLLVLGGLTLYVLHTETGSRFAVNQLISYANVNASYETMSGTLSDGLTIQDLRYQDDSLDVQADQFAYQSSWFWFNRELILNQIQINNVSMTSKENTQTQINNTEFNGMMLPLSIDIKKLQANNISWISGTETQTIDSLELVAGIERQDARIEFLRLQMGESQFTASGEVDYATGLNYNVFTELQFQSPAQNIQATGAIKGNLKQVNTTQSLTIDVEQLKGQFELVGSVQNLLSEPTVNVSITSQNSQVEVNSKTFNIKQLTSEIKGNLEEYVISMNSNIEQQQLDDITLPTIELMIDASGNSQQLKTNKAHIVTAEGRIELDGLVNWHNQLSVDSLLYINQFNPQQLISDWPGIINGQLQFNLSMSEQGITISTINNQLSGQLKGQPFRLEGDANYTANTFSANQLKLSLGDNQIWINGQVNETTVALKSEINWLDLELFDPNLKGTIEGQVELSGSFQAPQIKADLTAPQLSYFEDKLNRLTIRTEGIWQQQLATNINAESATLGGQNLNQLSIQQRGWLEAHDFILSADHDDFNTVMELTGQYTIATPSMKASWNGLINKHQMIVDSNKSITLQNPINVKIAEKISIEPGCWQGVEAGTLCVELNDIKQAEGEYQGSVTVDAFSLVPLQVLLPENLTVNGRLNGNAKFNYRAEELNVTSDMSLEEGEFLLFNGQEISYQSVISQFNIDAETTQDNIKINVNSELSDGSYLKLKANLDNSDQQQWKIDSSVDGVFVNTELIQSLSEEIKELKGQVVIEGTVSGQLEKPVINVNLSQPEGHVVLARLGTVVEKIKLSIITDGLNNPVYGIKLSAENLATVNQGSIKSTGELSMLSNKSWQYKGELTGENFMLLNLPEARFNVTPSLTIQANQDSTDIMGELAIDSGHVTVKQLPPSSISNSDDMTIHTAESNVETKYPVNINLQAKINEPIKLDVIGLIADLAGSIQLIQTKNQPLSGKGIMTLSEGSYEIYGQKLDINEGEMTFNGALDNPRLKVKASRKSLSGDVTAGVELGGTVNNLQSNLYSEPSLSDIEKLSYIMTGRGIENSGSLNGEQLKQAAIVMGLNQSSPIFNQIQSQFGIDVLTLRESAVAADTVVEAGKKINDKLYVSYNQGLFNRLGFWMLKYKINQFLNLESTQGADQSVELVYTRKAEIKKTKPKDKTN